MNNIDLNYAVEKHQRLIKVSRTEQILRMIQKDQPRKSEPSVVSPTQSKASDSRKVVIPANGSQPA